MTAYYTKTGNPPAQTRGTSATERAEFALIETGFATAQAEVALKPAKAGDTYTGTHNFTGATVNAATQTVGDSTTKVATTAFVSATAFSTATGLPIASQAEMQSGTESALRAMSPLRVAQAIAALPGKLIRSARTSNTILAAADNGTFIDVTSGTFSQTFTAVATLGSGWHCFIRNSGTGDVTLDPNASETIDGLATFIMYPGEVRLIQCDGAAFRSVVLSPFARVITASLTFVTPPGYTNFGGIAWSAGASGQRTNAASISVGGAAGGAFPFTISATTMGASQTISIGAGGLAVAGVASSSAGGDTTIGSILTITGATGASGTAGAVAGYAGIGAGTGGGGIAFESPAAATSGLSGMWGGGTSGNLASSPSGSSLYGGGAGGGVDAAGVLRAAGSSTFGGAGGAAAVATNGTAGTAPGGGGGATQTGTQSGAGARGQVTIWGIV